jgi:hypothetical protein
MTSFRKSMLVFYLQMERGIAFILQTPWCSANWIFPLAPHFDLANICVSLHVMSKKRVLQACFILLEHNMDLFTWANFLEPIL